MTSPKKPSYFSNFIQCFWFALLDSSVFKRCDLVRKKEISIYIVAFKLLDAASVDCCCLWTVFPLKFFPELNCLIWRWSKRLPFYDSPIFFNPIKDKSKDIPIKVELSKSISFSHIILSASMSFPYPVNRRDFTMLTTW